MDADYAKEAAQMTRNQVLQQAAVSLVAQSNIVPKMALKLLEGWRISRFPHDQWGRSSGSRLALSAPNGHIAG